MSVAITEQYNVIDNSYELTGTIECPTLCTRCRISRCHYNRVRLCLCTEFKTWILLTAVSQGGASCDNLGAGGGGGAGAGGPQNSWAFVRDPL